MLRAQDPLKLGQQPCVQSGVPGSSPPWSAARTRPFAALVGGACPPLAILVQRAISARTARVSGCSGPETLSLTGSSAATGPGPRPIPASPVQWARLARAVRVSGWSGPGPGLAEGSSAANWSRAARGITRFPGPAGEVAADAKGGVVSGPTPARGRAAAPLAGRGPRRVSRFPVQRARLPRAARVSGCSGPRTRSRRAAARRTGRGPRPHPPPRPVQRARLARVSEGVGVLGAEDPLEDGQQRGELVAGRGRIPRLPGPAGEVARGR